MIKKKTYRTIILCALLAVTIYHTKAISMTIIFSALAAMILHPLVQKLEEKGASLPLASIVVVVGISIVLASIFGFLGYEGTKIVANLPSDKVETTIEDPAEVINEQTNIDLSKYPEQIDDILNKAKKAATKFAISGISSLNATITFLVSCPIFIFFMLISRCQLRKFYYLSFRKKNRHIANRILEQISLVYSRYVRGMVYVMCIVAVLTGLGLYLLGIQHAIYLGLLAGFLTIIPYFGIFVSAAVPVFIALMTKDSLWYAAGVIGVFIVVQFLEGNLITPKIMGEQVGLNPLVVIISIIIFGAIGGILGMVLTIPILALLKIVAYYIPGWKPFRHLLKSNK
ncbi:MAG: AI-2E family transporter [Flavobacteriales bacterium]|nr:AI-2E family transporter [Flavobacteriales bacterium]